MFERYRQPMLPPRKFLLRMARSAIASLIMLVLTIVLGMLAFHAVEGYSWIDSFLNSVLIMTGVGTVGTINSNSGKLLTGIYSIISTLIFFAILAIIFTPLLHRLLHRLHLDVDKKD